MSRNLFNFCLVAILISVSFASQLKRCTKRDDNLIGPTPAPNPPPTPQPPAPPKPNPIPVPVPVPVPAPAPQPPKLTPIESGNPNQPLKNNACFYMVSVQSGQAVTFGSGNMEVQLQPQKNNNDQVVCVEVGGPDYYFIHWRREWNRVFDIYGGGNADGVKLIKWPKHGGANQRFRFRKDASGYFTFIAVNSNKAFGLWGGHIAQSSPNPNNAAQKWRLIPA